MKQDVKKYLNSGKQTEITTKITQVSESIKGEGLEYILNVLEWLNRNIKYPQPEGIEKNDIFRKRTADKITSDGYATGCTDFALVLVALTRAKGIPTKYVEVINKDYFDEGDFNKVRGHVFAECCVGGRWVGVDPMAGYIKYSTRYPGFVVYARGLDSWDLGIHNLASLREKFYKFAMERKKKENG